MRKKKFLTCKVKRGLDHHCYGPLLKVHVPLREGQYNLKAMFYVENAKYTRSPIAFPHASDLQHTFPPTFYPYLSKRLYLYFYCRSKYYKLQNLEMEITTLDIQDRI